MPNNSTPQSPAKQGTQRAAGFSLRGATTAILLGHVLSIATIAQGQDCNSNGQDDALDLAVGTSFDCNANTIPDECELAAPIRFDDPRNVSLDFAPSGLTAADLNGDGLTDLIALSTQDRLVTPLLNADGVDLLTGQAVTLDGMPQQAVAGDFDGDGHLDLAITQTDPNRVTILHNDGQGILTVTANVSVEGSPSPLERFPA